jgi:integrase
MTVKTELIEAVKAASGINIKGSTLKAEAYLKIPGVEKAKRDSFRFPLTLDGLHKAIAWKISTIEAWRYGKVLEPSLIGACTMKVAHELADNDAKGWSTLDTDWRFTAPAHAWQFVEFVGENKKIDSVTYSDLEKFRKMLKARKTGRENNTLKAATVNKYLLCVHKMFETARKHGRYSLDGTKVIPEFPYMSIKSDNSRRCFEYDYDEKGLIITNEEEHFYNLCDKFGSKYLELKLLVQLGINTGMRKGEILKLKCNNINFRRSEINIPAKITKANKDRTVTMNNTTKAIIQYFVSNRVGTQPLIVSKYEAYLERDKVKSNGKHIWDASKIIKYFNKIRDLMGLTDDPNFCFHSTRHTHITRLLEQSVPPHVVQAWVGHKSIETTMKYVTSNMKFIADCANQIEQHPATKKANGL